MNLGLCKDFYVQISRLQIICSNLLSFFYLDVTHARMNEAPNETRTHFGGFIS